VGPLSCNPSSAGAGDSGLSSPATLFKQYCPLCKEQPRFPRVEVGGFLGKPHALWSSFPWKIWYLQGHSHVNVSSKDSSITSLLSCYFITGFHPLI